MKTANKSVHVSWIMNKVCLKREIINGLRELLSPSVVHTAPVTPRVLPRTGTGLPHSNPGNSKLKVARAEIRQKINSWVLLEIRASLALHSKRI